MLITESYASKVMPSVQVDRVHPGPVPAQLPGSVACPSPPKPCWHLVLDCNKAQGFRTNRHLGLLPHQWTSGLTTKNNPISQPASRYRVTNGFLAIPVDGFQTVSSPGQSGTWVRMAALACLDRLLQARPRPSSVAPCCATSRHPLQVTVRTKCSATNLAGAGGEADTLEPPQSTTSLVTATIVATKAEKTSGGGVMRL